MCVGDCTFRGDKLEIGTADADYTGIVFHGRMFAYMVAITQGIRALEIELQLEFELGFVNRVDD